MVGGSPVGPIWQEKQSINAGVPVSSRISLVVEYDGTAYMGFQFQPDQPTIQGELENSLYKFTRERIRIRGASRTDSGAHAEGQVVDFLTGSKNGLDSYAAGLNFYLPRDIRVQAAHKVSLDFHSRKDAVSRVYRYNISNRQWPSPLRRYSSHWVRDVLNVDWMAGAAKHLVGEYDFRPFAPGFAAERSAVRRVHQWNVRRDEDSVIVECEANGFLKHQIRRATGLLIEIGKGKWPEDIVEEVLTGRTASKLEWTSVPACGLCLMKVTYPNFPPQDLS